MLTSVIIILREVLEASLLISILLALHQSLHFYRRWLVSAICLGFIGAFFYASHFGRLSAWADGNGQEIVNGVSLFIISICLAGQIIGITHRHEHSLFLTLGATTIIMLSLVREGAEIIVYYSMAGIHPEKLSSMFIGGVVGAGLGICIGILVFVLLSRMTRQKLVITTSIFLALIAAGLMTEVMQSAIQAGFVITDEPLWNTSAYIPEASVTGQLLYAMFSYEASPTTEEVAAWILTNLVLLSVVFWNRHHLIRKHSD